jgi:GT2 family glycosyltransferase
LKNLLHRLTYAIPSYWRKWLSSISIIKLCYNFIFLGYSPKTSYKKLLKKQKNILDTNHEIFDSASQQKITVVIEFSSDYKGCLKACLDSLEILKNEIDSVFLIHDCTGDEDNTLTRKMLSTILIQCTFSHTITFRKCFLKKIDSINTEALVWCQTPVVFHHYSFKTLLKSYSANENRPTAIYSDHDIICNGERISPSFKPDLNIDWLLCSNYMGNVILFDKIKLLNKIERLQLSIHDGKINVLHALLKVIATDSLCLIKHVPYVLYSEQSVGEGAVTKKYADVTVRRINWPLPKNLPLVSIIIPTRNGKLLVQQCIESLYRFTHYKNFEVLLVDNASDEVESIEYFKQLETKNKVKLLHYNSAFNYSAINNFAVQYSKGDVLLFMNNDIELLHETWLDEMVMQVMREEVGCVGAKLYYPNMTIQHAGVIVGLWGCAGHSHKHFKHTDSGYMNRLKVVQNYSAVTAACMAVRKTVFNEVEGFNEEDLTVAFNDVDLCLKIQVKGYRNLWTPYAEMIHHESSSRGSEDTPEKKIREAKEIAYMQSTWQLDIKVDPAYSKWLTPEKEDFSFTIEKR